MKVIGQIVDTCDSPSLGNLRRISLTHTLIDNLSNHEVCDREGSMKRHPAAARMRHRVPNLGPGARRDLVKMRDQVPGTDALHEFALTASRCRTPRQFRELLEQMKTILPYRHLMCGWGYRRSYSIAFI